MQTAMGCYVLSGEHTFSEEQEEMYVECSSVRLGATSFELDDSRCVEESQRATASDTSSGGGVAERITVKHQVTLSALEEC